MGALELSVKRSAYPDYACEGISSVEAPSARESLSLEECAMFLGSAQIGRIAVSIGALPVILPVNYLAMDASVWFRARSDGILLRAALGSVVAFEADGYDEVGSFGWSVLVRGVAEEITDQRVVEVAKASFIDAWPRAADADRFIVIPATMLSGQRYPRTA